MTNSNQLSEVAHTARTFLIVEHILLVKGSVCREQPPQTAQMRYLLYWLLKVTLYTNALLLGKSPGDMSINGEGTTVHSDHWAAADDMGCETNPLLGNVSKHSALAGN